MKAKNYLLTILVGLSMFACSLEDTVKTREENNSNSLEETTAEIMSFESKDAFKKALDSYDITKGETRSSHSFSSANNIYNDFSKENTNAEQIGFLVPDEKFRHFLNKNLEIIVNDTLYRITKDGTFFTHRSNKIELEEAITQVNNFTKIAEGLKKLGNVKLKDTFGKWNDNSSSPIDNEQYFDEDSDDVVIPNQPTTRAATRHELTREDVQNFPTVGAVKVHIADKIIRFSPSYLKHTKIRFSSNSRRKLYVSLYKYDYAFGVSIGIDCKVMKKLWHGLSWGRMVNWDDGIYYGLSSLIVRQQIKEPAFNDFMNFNKSKLQQQWNSLNNHRFTTYAEATKNLNGGIKNRWTTEYNGNPTKSPYIIPIIGESIYNVLGDNKASEKLAKNLDHFLVNKGINFFSGLDTSNSGKQIQFFSENDKAVYSFFSNDLTWNGGGYKIHDTFLKYYRNVVVGVSINFGGSKSNINVKPDISDNDFLGAPEIFFCEGIVYTRDGSGWIGAKIIQEAPDRTFSTGNFGGRR